MINWFNMPAEGLSNGGQFEIKELTATENRTYEKDGEVYNKVTVNVSGGGGGSSDFSTAEVTINIQGTEYFLIAIVDDVIKEETITESGTYTVPLYKGVVLQPLPPDNLSEPPAFTGDIEMSIEDFGIKVTGNGSITLVGSVS